jgi:mRNA interferase RelE/StbE
MKVRYRKKFLKQLAQLPSGPRSRVEQFVFEVVPNAPTIEHVGNIERMRGYRCFYKARFGPYRVGMRLDRDTLIFQVVMDRKEIYRSFP